MFILCANKNQLAVQQRETVTSGSVNVHEVRFNFSPEWDGLARTAVFRAGGETRCAALGEDGACMIPWEVMARPNVPLLAGVYGTRGGETVLPTIWAGLGTVLEGVIPGGDAQPPPLDMWEQELARKGDRLAYTPEGELGLYGGGKLLSAAPVKVQALTKSDLEGLLQ